jgi:hypothetical protein
MPQLTPGQARVIDPVLTTVAQGYKNSEMVGHGLFPFVPVAQRGGKIITFGSEDFRLYSTLRAPGANTKRVTYGYSGASFALEQHSLEAVVDVSLQQEGQVVGIDSAALAMGKVQRSIYLRLEKAQADLATNAANYGVPNKATLAGLSQWSDYTGTSKPVSDIETAKEAVRSQTGKRPNTVLMGAAVWAKLREHPTIVDRVKYTGRDSATPDLIAGLFGVERILVGDALYENAAGAKADVWGKFVVVAYTELGSLADAGAPSFGYTYRLSGYPIAEVPYDDRGAKSVIYPVTDEVMPVIAGASAGYLISAAVA